MNTSSGIYLAALLFGLVSNYFSVHGIVHQEAGFDLYDQLNNLADRGLLNSNEVRLILDVGAFNGEFSEELRKRGRFPQAQYLCIEANHIHAGHLQNKNLPFVISLVGDVDDEEVPYYRVDTSKSQLETGNSIYRENSEYFDNARVEYRKSYTIDYVLDLLNVSHVPVDILKLDIQGAELKALRGAKRMIERSPNLVIVCEISFVPYNGADAPSFFDIHYEMEKMGFKMVDILGYSSGKKEKGNGEFTSYALQFDAAWVRREKLHWRGVSWPKKNYPSLIQTAIDDIVL